MKLIKVDPHDLFSTFVHREGFNAEEKEAIVEAMVLFLERTDNPLAMFGNVVAIMFAFAQKFIGPNQEDHRSEAEVMTALGRFMCDRAIDRNFEVAMRVLEQANEAAIGTDASARLSAAQDAVFEKIDAEREEKVDRAMDSVREMLGGEA